jgi:hypothetical protein
MRVGRTAQGCDSQAVSEGWRGGDLPLTGHPQGVRAFNAAVRGARAALWVEGSLERGGTPPEGHQAPERGGNSLEGHQAL